MSAAASMLIPGAGMIQNVIEKMSDQIVAMVDEILTEKADAMMYEIIQPKIEECLKSIFNSSPMQLEAAKMFNREIFPIYKQSLDDFADFNALAKGANAKIDAAFEEFTKAVIENKDDVNKKAEAKTKLMEKLKGISDTNVGDTLTMKGGDLNSFLKNPSNSFKTDSETKVTKYLSSNVNVISDAINEIVGKTKGKFEEFEENMKKSADDFSLFNKSRRAEMRIPGISACPNIDNMKKTEESLKDIENTMNLEKLKDLTKVPPVVFDALKKNKDEFVEGKKLNLDISKNLGKMFGGKSYRRVKKQNNRVRRTHKKIRTYRKSYSKTI